MNKNLLVLVILLANYTLFAQTKEEKIDELLSIYSKKNTFSGTALIYHKVESF